jgi:hypothetical protein
MHGYAHSYYVFTTNEQIVSSWQMGCLRCNTLMCCKGQERKQAMMWRVQYLHQACYVENFFLVLTMENA